jgi:Zn-dependent peptidase ImmA (M78 family)
VKIDKIEIEQHALSLRKENGINTNGIGDIFVLVNRQDIELIRYPFGQNTILGFATMFEGKKIIVTNSSEILSREIYTVAHELGHIEYDFSDNSQLLKIDENDTDIETDYSESRAYYFADCLLMPENNIRDFIRYSIKKDPSELSAINIVAMQLEFNVSFSALVQRLLDLKLINYTKKDDLYSQRDFYTSKRLFQMISSDDDLLKPYNKIAVPPKYSDYVLSNYQNGIIPFSSLSKAFSLLGIDVSDMEQKKIESDDSDIDSIFEEYK